MSHGGNDKRLIELPAGGSHNVASHSDTGATGAELTELTDGSTTTLHAHSGSAAADDIRNYLNEPVGTPHGDDDEFDNDTFGGTLVQPTGTVTATELRHALSLKYSGQSSLDISGAMFSLTPSSAPVTIEAAISSFSMSGSHSIWGIGFADGVTATDNVNTVTVIDNVAGITARYGTYTNLSNAVSIGTPLNSARQSHWFIRHIWQSANTWAAQVSNDGISWITVDTGRSVTLTPTHFGLFCTVYGGSHTSIISAEYIRVTESDLSA